MQIMKPGSIEQQLYYGPKAFTYRVIIKKNHNKFIVS